MPAPGDQDGEHGLTKSASETVERRAEPESRDGVHTLLARSDECTCEPVVMPGSTGLAAA